MKRIKKIISLLSFFCISILSSCAKDYEIGNFYTLSKAFYKGYINHQDLLNIAYYYNGEKNVNEDFELKEVNQSDLDEYTINSIIYSHYEEKREDSITIDEIEITDYYGTYNGAVCVVVFDNTLVDILVFEEYFIDGVKFLDFVPGFPHGPEIWVPNSLEI